MKKTYLFAGIAIFLWSTVATVCKLLLGTLNNFQLLWMNASIAGIFLLLVNLVCGHFKKYKNYRFKDYLIMAGIGIPGTLFYYIFFYAGTDMMPASQAFIINYLWPIMSVVCACIVLKEKFTPKKILAILISFLGVVIVMGGALKSWDKQTLMGALCCILGAVSYGIFTSLNQKMNYNKTMTLMSSYFATFIITTVINGVRGDMFVPQMNQWAGFLWNGIFAVAIANTCWVVALTKGNTAKVSNLAYITPFLSGVWTCIFLKEEITLNMMLGLAVIILGVFVQMNDKPKNKEIKVVK